MKRHLATTLTAPPKLAERTVYQSPWLSIRATDLQMPSGRPATFYLRHEPDVAVCLPITADGAIILVEEYRHGPGRSLFEIPGGLVDQGEMPLDAARREVLEETGYAGDVLHLGSGWISAYSTARKHAYVMQDARKVAEHKIEETEMLRIIEATPGDLRDIVLAGELTDLDAGLLCLRHLGL